MNSSAALIELSLILRREVNKHPLISKYFTIATNAQMVPAEHRASGFEDFHADGVSWKTIYDAWASDEFVLDPTSRHPVVWFRGL